MSYVSQKRRFVKCITSMVLTVCVLAGLMLVGKPMEAKAMTTQSAAVNWIISQKGKTIDADAAYGAQCVDLIKVYFDYLGVARISGNAKDYASKTPPSGWQRIQGASIQPGDVVIWTGGASGHVALAISDSKIVEQNFNGQQYCTEYDMNHPGYNRYTHDGYWGVWRPNFNAETPMGSPLPPGSRTVSDGDYHIVSALEGNHYIPGQRCLTIEGLPGAENTQGANAELWPVFGQEAHVFTVTWLGNGYYKIKLKNSSTKALDVPEGSLERGTNVWQWDDHGGDTEQWVIETTDDGTGYVIRAKCNGWYLDVENGSTNGGTNISLWEKNNADNQKWFFVPWGGGDYAEQELPDGEYHIVPKLDNNKALNAEGDGTTNGTNIILWPCLGDRRHTFNVRWLGDGYYEIVNKNSDLALDVKSGLCRDATVNLWGKGDGYHQKWIIRSCGDGYFNIISKCNGLYLDLLNGNTNDGADIGIYVGWGYTGRDNQKWKFVPYKDFKRGDINGDGEVTMADLMMCLHHVSERSLLAGTQFQEADIDGDSKVTMGDLMRILHYVSGRNKNLTA